MAKRLIMTTFDYDHVRLVPGPCAVKSRSEVDTGVQFGPRRFALPVVPANMSTIIDESFAAYLARNDYFYIMHRFDVDAHAFIRRMHEADLYSSISVGVQDEDFAAVRRMSEETGPTYVTIDIAHGDSPAVTRMVEHVKTLLPHTYVIAGNVATPAAVQRLENAGADAVKVGIGPGAACLTAPNTGFGTQGWQLSAIESCAAIASTAQIVADGGIREYGDVAKSVAFGADMVMIGSMFAGHDENPGELIEESDGSRYKVFFGSASEHQKGEDKYVEGTRLYIPYRGPVASTLQHVRENLQSAISYSGGRELSALADATYVVL